MVSSPGPVPPISNSLRMRSSKVAKPEVCQATHTLTSSLALPIQLNLVPSNWAPGWPSSGSSAVPRPMVPKAVPSLGAAL